MGILKSKKMKLKEKHPYNKDIKNGTLKKEASKKETNLPGNLNNTANTIQGQGHTQLFSHQMESSHGNEAMLTRMHQVPAVDAPQNKAVNISQDADPVKYIPYLASDVRVTQQHTSPTKPKDNKTSSPKRIDALLLQFQQQQNRQVMFGPIQHKEYRHFLPSQQNPAAKETTEVSLQTASASVQDASPQVKFSFGSKEQQDTIFQFLASKRQAPVRRICKTETDFVFSNVNKSNTDLTWLATEKAHNIAEQITTTKLGVAEVHATMPAEPPGNSRQMSSQPKTQVSNKENALNSVTNVTVDHQYCFSAKSKSSCTDTAKIRQTQKLAKKIKAQSGAYRKRSQQTAGQTVKTVQETSQQQGCTAMEENTTKKHNKPHQILQPNKADNDTNENTGIHQVKVNAPALQVPVVEEIPTVVPNNPVTHNPTAGPDTSTRVQHEPKGPTAVKSKKKHKLKEVYQNQPKNTGSVTAKEEINGNMEEEINGKNNQVEKEKHEPAITSVVAPDLVCAEGRWHPFTVNPSCSHKVHCRHNPGMGLPQNVQKWFYECPNYLCEPAWIITARLAACIALRLTEEEGEDSHQ